MKALSLLAVATLGFATAATAAPRTAPEPAPAPAADKKIDDQRRVCLVDDVTGSRIRSRACHTIAEWKKQGVDPLAKN